MIHFFKTKIRSLKTSLLPTDIRIMSAPQPTNIHWKLLQ